MNRDVWILDEDQDNLSMVIAFLMDAGMGVMGFRSPEAVLSYAARRDTPRGGIIDARTAEGLERHLRSAIPWRLVVLTTSSTQLVPWLSLGISRFLLKPYDLSALLEHFDGVASQPAARKSVIKASASAPAGALHRRVK